MSRSMAPAGVAAAGLIALLLGIVPSWWFVGGVKLGPDGQAPERARLELAVGLTSLEACTGARCGELAFRGMPAPDADDAAAGSFRRFVWAGAATFWGGVTVAVAIGGALLVWLLGKRLPASPATLGGALALGVAAAAVIAFVLEPAMPQLALLRAEPDLRMGLGLPLTLLGCAGCAVGGLLLARDERGYPFVGAPRPAPAVLPSTSPPLALAASLTPACPRCHAPTIFVAEHQRHFCSSCRAYL